MMSAEISLYDNWKNYTTRSLNDIISCFNEDDMFCGTEKQVLDPFRLIQNIPNNPNKVQLRLKIGLSNNPNVANCSIIHICRSEKDKREDKTPKTQGNSGPSKCTESLFHPARLSGAWEAWSSGQSAVWVMCWCGNRHKPEASYRDD